MVSLWGRKRSDSETEPHEQYHQGEEQGYRGPDERTRLLPPEASRGYLDPDDPAVSPYNLWSIRALRALSLGFLAISFVWWTFLLVSIFVSPPLMYTRGSGFFEFSYTTLTVGYLLIGLLFFAIPSKPMTIWGIILAVLLLVDMCIILGVPQIRVEEGWVGIASVVWATFISIYNVVQIRFVAWGKKEEEERLTGREETRRSLREWVAVLAETIIMAIMVIIAILLTATLTLRSRDASLAPPGKRYYVDGERYQVHLACVGNFTGPAEDGKGSALPTVLLEGGEGPVEHSLQPFIHQAYRNGTIDRYCYWDRPGFAWSDNAPSPHSAGMAADALSEALALAGEEGPWVVVSAGIGSIYSRIFASRHLFEVQGIFLIDPLHEDELGGTRIGNPGRGFTLWARGIISPLGLDRLAGAIFKGRTREDRIVGRSAYQSGKLIKAQLQENLVAPSMSASEVRSARNIQMPRTPLVVVSSGVEVRRSEKWANQQQDLSRITDNLLAWDTVKAAPHEVWKTLRGREVIEKRLGQLVRS
ncbi:hypothetical protein ASPZODRAFT_63565 [Penicilliopsis zonata CBS 506.65]|uniref:Mitochondrial integral membrane protein n=1 Tax=Penicilliopsis zonata CBS 506.65 TaxID=1073090 RepID=A0A1L9SLG6_9EURO|nr:hypothetical protein ASPZODRAFT_63565 [Penicilliopsis zonata CBS 506.65]OJJ47917.1 hypothetical protein ASPZODRAFT_63565 [Penicilliopsis zonata CBS 506.65]